MKRFFVLTILFYAVFTTFISYRVSKAYFASMAISTTNTFTAAAQFPTGTPPATTSGTVVINEIMWTGSQGNSADEWIELRNMTNNTIDLSNWKVDNLGTGTPGTVTIPVGKSIAPGGFFVISNDTEAGSIMSVTPDLITNLSLSNNGELLVLKDSSNTIIDSANRDGDWYAGEDPTGQQPKKSMERNNTPGDGTIAGNWHTASSQTNIDAGNDELATPKAANGL